MGKALIIAEKPSVAAELSKALAKAPEMSKFKKHREKDYFENETHIIAAAVGHLVELPLPTEGGKKMKWDLEKLPILPEKFALKPIDKTKKRFQMLRTLMRRKEVDLIINACDAGREGELIFRYLLEAAEVEKPVKRLWMQSMTSQALVSAWAGLRSDEEMEPLAAAARCRSESDWLVGINGTRALTAYNSRYGGFIKTPVGRVQTPTLTILVNREREILAFRDRIYYEIHADFDVAAGTYESRWFLESFRKAADTEAKAERLWNLEAAEAIVTRCRGREGAIEETSKPKKQSPPLLYDLTSLQRDASNRFGFSARRTLQIAQSLYEKHKALTYPRTDSRYLPGDYSKVVIDTLKALAKGGSGGAGEVASFARRVIDKGMVKAANRRVFNSAKVSDHFAIIPTGTPPGARLSEAEGKIYDAVVRRFVAVFFEAAESLVTTRITRIDDDAFKTTGKILVNPGWLAVYGKESQTATAESDEESVSTLVPVDAGEKARNSAIDLKEKRTKPPPRYNEATLLSAMEGAGKLVEDEELREAMSERGLGTPATRASIIEGLIHDLYVHRDGRSLIATAKGIRLIDQLESIDLKTLCAPKLTGDWEFRLKEMEHGRLDRKTFMDDIRVMTVDIVESIRTAMDNEPEYPPLSAACPDCGSTPLSQTEVHYSCPSPKCRFRIAKIVASRLLAEEEVKMLLETGSVGPLGGFRSRSGNEFSAILQRDEKGKVAFVFDDEGQEKPELEDPVAECPLCREAGRKGRIHAIAEAYVCEGYFEEPKCPARLPKNLLKVTISREQAVKFFTTGRTDVIKQFISKRGRPFSASLVLNGKGEKLIEWEFPPRQPRPARKKAGGKKSTKSG